MSSAGDAKTGTAGVANDIFTNWIADTDTQAASAFQAGYNTVGNAIRKMLGAQINAIVNALLGAAPTGSVSINLGSNSVVATNAAITSSSVVLCVITQAATDATLTYIARVVPVSGSVTIVGNANATAAVTVRYAVFN